MSHHGISTETHPAWATLRDRCRALGLHTWRCDGHGNLIEDAPGPGLLPLWLHSAPVRTVVGDAARGWTGAERADVLEVAPGFWLIPVRIEQRRRRVGMTIAAALGPELPEQAIFELGCRAAGIDAMSTRAALKKCLAFDARSAGRKRELLQWMADDLGALTEHESAINGFTLELSQSYETIDLLYTLGRSMRDLSEPEAFVEMLSARLHETLPFEWLVVQLLSHPRSLGPLSGRGSAHGRCPLSTEARARLADRVSADLQRERRTLVLSVEEAGDARVMAQGVYIGDMLVGMMACGDRKGDDPQVSSYDMQLIEAAAAFAGAFLENARLYRDQRAMFLGSVRALSAAIDAKDRYTQGHSERVAHLGALLARSMNDPTLPADRVHLSGLLHDVGKIGVPEAVLCKAGRLTDEEFAQIKRHPQIGHDILNGIPLLADVLPGVLHHHERWDGKGYPHGLSGEAIPLIARVLGIADTFDAMSSNRAYRPALPRARVLEEIERCAGGQFDPTLARRFITLDFSQYDAMVATHAVQQAYPAAA